MTHEEAKELQDTFVQHLKGEVSDQELEAIVEVKRILKAEGLPSDYQPSCWNCGIEPEGWLAKEYLLSVGICHGCDDAQADAKIEARSNLD